MDLLRRPRFRALSRAGCMIAIAIIQNGPSRSARIPWTQTLRPLLWAMPIVPNMQKNQQMRNTTIGATYFGPRCMTSPDVASSSDGKQQATGSLHYCVVRRGNLHGRGGTY